MGLYQVSFRCLENCFANTYSGFKHHLSLSSNIPELIEYLFMEMILLGKIRIDNLQTLQNLQRAVDVLDLKPSNMIGSFGTGPDGDPRDRPGAFSPSSFTCFTSFTRATYSLEAYIVPLAGTLT